MLQEPLSVYLNERVLYRWKLLYFSSGSRYLLHCFFPMTAALPVSLDVDLEPTPTFYELPNITNYLAHDRLHLFSADTCVLLLLGTFTLFFFY